MTEGSKELEALIQALEADQELLGGFLSDGELSDDSTEEEEEKEEYIDVLNPQTSRPHKEAFGWAQKLLFEDATMRKERKKKRDSRRMSRSSNTNSNGTEEQSPAQLGEYSLLGRQRTLPRGMKSPYEEEEITSQQPLKEKEKEPYFITEGETPILTKEALSTLSHDYKAPSASSFGTERSHVSNMVTTSGANDEDRRKYDTPPDLTSDFSNIVLDDNAEELPESPSTRVPLSPSTNSKSPITKETDPDWLKKAINDAYKNTSTTQRNQAPLPRPFPPKIVDEHVVPPSGPQLRCVDCGDEITDGTAVKAMGKVYHMRHFVCHNGCGAELARTQFVIAPDGLTYCSACHAKVFRKPCSKCKKPILSAPLKVFDVYWHKECFTCTHCNRPLFQRKFFAGIGNVPECDTCHTPPIISTSSPHNTKKNTTLPPLPDSSGGGKVCAKCAGSLDGTHISFLSAIGKYWHPEHFTCALCPTNLGSVPFYTHDGKPYCESHKFGR